MSKLIGTDPNQVPSNADLGNLAYADKDNMPQISAKWVDVFNPNNRQSNLELHSSDFYRDSGDADLAYNWRFTNEGNVNRLRLMGYNPKMSPTNIFPFYVEGDTQDIVTTGNIRMSNGQGIDFSATGNSTGTTTSEILDDYEEGTFTVGLRDGSGTSLTVGSESGRYTKIGRLVYIEGTVQRNDSQTLTSNLQITGLPFTSRIADSIGVLGAGTVWMDEGGPSTNNGDTVGHVYLPSNQTYFQLVRATSSGAQTSNRYGKTNELTNTRSVYFNFTYVT